MALEYSLKSNSADVLATLREAGIQPGMNVLDFGCGPGRYALPAAAIVETEGMVYAVDVHPVTIKIVKRRAAKAGMTNVRTIHTDCDTSLSQSSIDVVLLYDALHDMREKEHIMRELYRVLKPQGTLSYKDHTLNGEPLLSLMRLNGFSIQGETSMQTIFRKS
jgi:ubiquinone/menaquinone biosynthesis C-methylase UbiE